MFLIAMYKTAVEEQLSCSSGRLLKRKADHCVKELLLNFEWHLQILQHLAPLKKVQMSQNRLDIFH